MTNGPHRARGWYVVAAIGLGLAACSSSPAHGAAVTAAGSGGASTIPAGPAATSAPATSAPATAAPGSTTSGSPGSASGPSAPSAPTTGPPSPANATPPTPGSTPVTAVPGGPPCQTTALFSLLQAAPGGLPPGTGAETPACVAGWATMVVGAPGQDRALAVFRAAGDTWALVNLGTSSVCSDAKVPVALFGALDCAAWENG